MQKLTIIANAVNAKVLDPTPKLKKQLLDILSYKVEEGFGMTKWTGISSFYEYSKEIFPAGLVNMVSQKLVKLGYQVQVLKKPLPPPLGEERPNPGSYPYDPRYEYQYQVSDALIRHGQIIAMISTGGGKTRCAEIAFARINRPTLFLTTRQILMYQMKDNFEKVFGTQVSVIGDGQFGLTKADGSSYLKKFTVATVQTLQQRLRDPKSVPYEERLLQKKIYDQTINLLSKFEFVILEEAHEASGNGYFDVLRHCVNAHYRLALTATPFMKENEESNLRLMASSGPIGIRVTEEELIQKGILAKPYFKFAHLNEKPAFLTRRTPWQSAYRLGIVENIERNRIIVEEVLKAVSNKLTVMVLVQHKAHGEMLKKYIENIGIKTEFIFGENDQNERQNALNKLKNGEISCLIGSTILDVGVDVPAVGMVVLAGAGKAQVALRQRIGRGLRAKKQGANICFILDFDDPFNATTEKHAKQRMGIIKNTRGFGENFVLEFPYHLLKQ